MINLIPKERKQAIAYARYNASLLRWLIIMTIALAGLVIIVLGGLFYIRQDINDYKLSIANSEKSLADQDEKATLDEVSAISTNLSLIVNVLSKEVVFSELLPHIGTLVPDGALLNDLSLSRDTQDAIELSISTIDYPTASQVLVNLQSSQSLLFEGADINNVNCDSSSEKKYPCEVSIMAMLVKDNPFLLLNDRSTDE